MTSPQSVLITNIGELVTNDRESGDLARRVRRTERANSSDPAGGLLGVIEDAALVLEDGLVAWVGGAADAPAADEMVDAGGRAVLPGFVDSHSHLVFAGDRAEEFRARMAGEEYAAGGIRTTVAATRAASDDALAVNVERLVAEMRRQGTTTVEIKSGYGLTAADEAR
jgi:imidazolonepropionase